MHGSLSEHSTAAVNSAAGTWPAINAAQQFVVVKAPIARVYEQWSRIEGFAGVRHLAKPFLPADLLRLTRELASLPRVPAPALAGSS